jgi:hypothetical protein
MLEKCLLFGTLSEVGGDVGGAFLKAQRGKLLIHTVVPRSLLIFVFRMFHSRDRTKTSTRILGVLDCSFNQRSSHPKRKCNIMGLNYFLFKHL